MGQPCRGMGDVMCARRGRRPRIGLAAAVVATALAAIGQFAPVASANPTDTALVAFHGVQGGKCLEVSGFGLEDGHNVRQWQCPEGRVTTNMVWRLVPVGYRYYELQNYHSGKCLEVAAIDPNQGA